jgi:ferrous iron transport protein A
LNQTRKTLGDAPVGYRGTIRALAVDQVKASLPPAELERRLVELGFTEGMDVTILHEGLIGRDPIAVRVGHTTFALRRAEARAVLVDSIADEMPLAEAAE